MTLYVDADACPVKDEALRAAVRHNRRLVLVCNGGIRPVDHPLVEMVYVGDGLDEADRWIAEHAGKGDIVVTSDIPLAAACVRGNAIALKPDGTVITERNVGETLALRDLMTDLRSANPLGAQGGRGFGPRDRSRFLEALDRLLRGGAG
ncbi:MAG: YaiI/YqxD family protein [Defluviimonas sp.]|uniref:YaiI/YqxD family protein n=1 Tax=Albidovulum sp. TaxID=1872424 RepID=UPI001D8BBEEF|nr:YaiI/YqxD family protein [Paracoccaceae bacterium]MCC0063312.1 YaiI/YqxD family protein [Defluviimonas sp.]